jgi:hypothetical protein
MFRECGDRYNEADTLASLGDAHHANGDTGEARFAWQCALAILEQLKHPGAAAVRARMHAVSERVTRQP